LDPAIAAARATVAAAMAAAEASNAAVAAIVRTRQLLSREGVASPAPASAASRDPRADKEEDAAALRAGVLADMFPPVDATAASDGPLAKETAFASSTRCGYLLGKHLALTYDVPSRQLTVYVAVKRLRIKFVLTAESGGVGGDAGAP
jgi:hypothetical protein